MASFRQASLSALLILVLSLIATLAAWRWTAQQGETLERTRFNQFMDEAVTELRGRMDSYNQLLRSGVALLEASDRVDRSEWNRFVDRLDVGRLYPGTQGVGFAVRVEGDRWAEHEQAVRAQGFPDYAIKPAGPRELSFPILYIEPFSGRNLRAFGYDMFSEPVRHEAMSRARDTGMAALTGKVTLVQETETDVQPGVLLYYPYYGEAPPADLQARHDAIQGFVYSPLRMGDLARAVLGDRSQFLCAQIYDQQDQLFASQNCPAGEHSGETTINVFGRQWIIRIQSTKTLDEQIASRRSRLILGAGATISLLLVWAVISMQAERNRRLALARALTDLEAARAEAAGASAAKGRFLAAASHDLRQPLQSLGLYLHMMIEKRGGSGPIEQAAQQAFNATARLVEAMFDAAALESGRANPVKTRFDMADLIGRIAAESRPEAQAAGLTLRSRLCHVEVETDQVMLERIVRNLVSNALKYTKSGSVLIACRSTAEWVRIKVADSGPGIPEDKRELIFEDFYQLENPDRDHRKGLGLGLATVSRLSRVLGYNLKVLSREGLGSTFVVEIPRAPEKVCPSQAA